VEELVVDGVCPRLRSLVVDHQAGSERMKRGVREALPATSPFQGRQKERSARIDVAAAQNNPQRWSRPD
jgi:hypothetical protein